MRNDSMRGVVVGYFFFFSFQSSSFHEMVQCHVRIGSLSSIKQIALHLFEYVVMCFEQRRLNA